MARRIDPQVNLFAYRDDVGDLSHAGLPDFDMCGPEIDSIMRRAATQSGPVHRRLGPVMTEEEVRGRRKAMARRIFEDWTLLAEILDGNEARLHKRWAKKTKKQRQEVLLAAWPNMSLQHRPDFAALWKESDQERRTGTKFREAYLWPYINLEDLSKPHTLLLLLNARAKHAPDAFAFADFDAIRLGMVTRAIKPAVLWGHHMIFRDRKTPETYGELRKWERNDPDLLCPISGMLAGGGLLTLEIQQRLMSFLVECCKLTMHDYTMDRLTTKHYPAQQLPAFSIATEHGFASLAALALEAPYRVPANLDLSRIESNH